MRKKAFASGDKAAYTRSNEMKQKLRDPMNRLRFMDLSATGVAAKNEVQKLKDQLSELARLKELARERNDKVLVKRIEEMELKIYRAVNTMSMPEPSELGVNYFDYHPLARKASFTEAENQKILAMRADVRVQREKIINRLAEIEIAMGDARRNKEYRKLIALELSRDRFEDLNRKLDYMETQSYALEMQQDETSFEQWTDYGAFGMTNVQFAIKNQNAAQIADMQRQIEQINKFLEMRKENIEHKINQITDEITVMTRRVREQERLREREELNRQFEESYFDTHDTEVNTSPNTTQPPKIEDNPEQ